MERDLELFKRELGKAKIHRPITFKQAFCLTAVIVFITPFTVVATDRYINRNTRLMEYEAHKLIMQHIQEEETKSST